MFGLYPKIMKQIDYRLSTVGESIESTVFVLNKNYIPEKIDEVNLIKEDTQYYKGEICNNCGCSTTYFKGNSATKCVLCKRLLSRTRVFVNQVKAMNSSITLAHEYKALDWIKKQCKKMRPEEVYQFTIIYKLITDGYKVLWEIGHKKTDRYDIVLPDLKLIVEVKATLQWKSKSVAAQLQRYRDNNPGWSVVGTHPEKKYNMMNIEELLSYISHKNQDA
ncbi:hypothetical protein ERW51_18645 [Aliivibrio finisterrensis]|uniref:hypothetical protein n=1 Tax=Aliivibrio finisterrensis TaxID=511998 RepID=UPI001022794F|nr:hypothetical protein [Aliivibrio finisterrensis]RYU62838.1 hypothetical protein ERW54_19115 [Aliivibrio finisterrensis]RYU65066.1 hypothetical protein ERW51_18645 [Aliivibrio finisterrensis]RYU68618.1 hypothetical protein ERW48_19215 [Aliivibrio finisterrensis]